MTKCPKLECGVAPQLILKHLISPGVSLAQLVSSSVALLANACFISFYPPSLGESSFLGLGAEGSRIEEKINISSVS